MQNIFVLNQLSSSKSPHSPMYEHSLVIARPMRFINFSNSQEFRILLNFAMLCRTTLKCCLLHIYYRLECTLYYKRYDFRPLLIVVIATLVCAYFITFRAMGGTCLITTVGVIGFHVTTSTPCFWCWSWFCCSLRHTR